MKIKINSISLLLFLSYDYVYASQNIAGPGLESRWSLFAVGVMGFICLLLGLHLIIYGIRAGFLKKKILTNHYCDTVKGKSAKYAGVFYIAVGIFFFLGSILIFTTLYGKMLLI